MRWAVVLLAALAAGCPAPVAHDVKVLASERKAREAEARAREAKARAAELEAQVRIREAEKALGKEGGK